MLERLFLPTPTTIELINPYDILFCQSEANHTNIHLINREEITVSRSLIVLQRELPPFLVRVSQTVIVNQLQIERIDKRNKKIFLRPGIIIPFTMTIRDLLARIQGLALNSDLNS